MKLTRCSELICRLLIIVAIILTARSVFAADALRIQPIRHDFGTIEEGVPAKMLVTVENVSAKEVHIKNVRTN